MKKNGKIEVLRFLFSVAVLLLHSKTFWPKGYIFPGGALSVDFFFILSGYLMAVSIEKKGTEVTDLGRETQQFLGKKICGFLPEYLVAWALGFLYMEIKWQDGSLVLLIKRVLRCVWEPLFLGMAGFGKVRVNSVDWYLSAMLLAMLILYPLCRKYFSMSMRVIMPAIAIFIYGFFFLEYGTTIDVYRSLGLNYKGTVRAFAGISAGVGLFPLIQWMQNAHFSRKLKIGLTILEPILYGAIFAYMFQYSKKEWDFACLLFIVVAFCITCSRQGLLDHWFDHKACYFLGKHSVLVYLSHVYVGRVLAVLLPEASYGCLLILYVTLTMVNCVVVYCLARRLRRKWFYK